MTKLQKIALFFILILMLALYATWLNKQSRKSIEIKPIKIMAPNIKRQAVTARVIQTKPADILSKLKIAAEASTKSVTPVQKKISKRKVSKKVRKVLKKKIKQQKIKRKIAQEKPKKKTKTKIITKVRQKQPPIAIIAKESISKPKLMQILTREEEVALYKSSYAKTLEVVNVSESFEIKNKNTLPDSHYFETIEEKPMNNNAPLEFVEKLGVLMVSDKYESDFTVPQKIEVAKEGIVTIPNASVETEEMKGLEFVDTLGVIEVSADFETIQAATQGL